MKITIKLAVIGIIAFVLCGCTNRVKRIKKADKYYIEQGYKMFDDNVKYQIPNNPDDSDYHYILFAKIMLSIWTRNLKVMGNPLTRYIPMKVA
jgi:hypothetical protein